MNLNDWREKILETVRDISDKDFQERVWLRGEGPEVSSWEEAMCMLYDDFMFEDFITALKARDGGTPEVKLLQKLNAALDPYLERIPDFLPAKDVLGDPEWVRIRELAKDVIAEADRPLT